MSESTYTTSALSEIYTQAEANGVIVIVVASAISLLAEVGLLVALLLAWLRPKFNTTAEYLFLQSNFGLYFISLLVADAIAATGSFMNVRWVSRRAVDAGSYCSAQGSVKNIGNVATALWILVIAIHVFNLLFLRHQTKRIAGIAVTVATWSFVGTIGLFGPAVLAKTKIGPYFGVAGFWCWITSEYSGARIGLEYFWFFFSAATSFVLYVLVFLRLRGNIVIPEGSRVPRFIWLPRAKAWRLQANRDAVDAHMTDVAKQMIWFPVAYTIVILPIAIDRFIENGGNNVSFQWLIFADSLFMSSGLINVILFLAVRKALPTPGLLPTFNIPRKPPPSVFIPPPEPKLGDVYPYIVGSAASDRSFGTKDRNSDNWDEKINPSPILVTNIGGAFIGRTLSNASTVAGSTGTRSPRPSPPREPIALPEAPEEQDVARGWNDPPTKGHQRDASKSSQTTQSTLHNPFSDEHSPTGSDDSFGRPRSEWQPTLSAYFESVDLTTPHGDRFPVDARPPSEIPPVPQLAYKKSNRI